MAKISEAQFKAQIKTREFSNAYLIYGKETYLKTEYVNLLKKKIVEPAFEDFNFHSYNGKDISLDEILKDAETLPMMSEYNFLLVCDYPFDKSDNEIKLIQEFLNDLPETTIIVFWYDALDFPLKNKDGKISAKSNKIENAFIKSGTVLELNEKSENELVNILIKGFEKRGTFISPINAKYFISVAGTSLQTLQNETNKIVHYVKEGEITKEIIDKLATKSFEARIDDLSKAIIAHNYDKAYSVLNVLFINEEKPEYILGTITKKYVDMYRVKCAKASGKSAEDIKKYFNYRFDSFIRNASNDSLKLSIEQLRQSLDILMQADNAIKSTSTDNKLIIEEATMKLISISERG